MLGTYAKVITEQALQMVVLVIVRRPIKQQYWTHPTRSKGETK